MAEDTVTETAWQKPIKKPHDKRGAFLCGWQYHKAGENLVRTATQGEQAIVDEVNQYEVGEHIAAC